MLNGTHPTFHSLPVHSLLNRACAPLAPPGASRVITLGRGKPRPFSRRSWSSSSKFPRPRRRSHISVCMTMASAVASAPTSRPTSAGHGRGCSATSAQSMTGRAPRGRVAIQWQPGWPRLPTARLSRLPSAARPSTSRANSSDSSRSHLRAQALPLPPSIEYRVQ
jgi:hypothetical protein